MDKWWVYVGAGVAGLLWGAGYVEPAVAFAYAVGVLMGANGDVAKWVFLALVAGYVVGSMMSRRRQVAAVGV
jgi:hypothetical protein